MDISQVWLDLAERGLVLGRAPRPPEATHDSVDIVLEGPGWEAARYKVTVLSRPMRPGVLARLAQESSALDDPNHVPLLVVTSEATDSGVLRAGRMGISVLVAPRGDRPTTGLLVHPQTGLVMMVGPDAPPRQPRRPGPVAWSTYAVAASLLESPAPSQTALAERCGITQGRVSKILGSLRPLWTRSDRGIQVSDPIALSDWLVREYPRRSVVETAWLTLEPLAPLARTTATYLEQQSVDYALSGDVVADLLAPWANPTVLRISVDAPLDLAPLGLTPAPRDSANVLMDVSSDPYVLQTRRRVNGLWTTEPWRVWLDLRAEGHDDAAHALRKMLIEAS